MLENNKYAITEQGMCKNEFVWHPNIFALLPPASAGVTAKLKKSGGTRQILGEISLAVCRGPS